MIDYPLFDPPESRRRSRNVRMVKDVMMSKFGSNWFDLIDEIVIQFQFMSPDDKWCAIELVDTFKKYANIPYARISDDIHNGLVDIMTRVSNTSYYMDLHDHHSISHIVMVIDRTT